MRESDFITIHTTLTKDTYHLIDEKAFFLMKSTAIIVNTARGSIIDKYALVEALEKGRIAGAGLDVTDPEPINMDSELLDFPNCVIVPHIASASFAVRNKMGTMAAKNLISGLKGEKIPFCANPKVYDRRQG